MTNRTGLLRHVDTIQARRPEQRELARGLRVSNVRLDPAMSDDLPPIPQTPPPADEEVGWLERARKGDEQAFGRLMRAHYDPVFRRVVALVRNEHDAQDLCQEIWLTVWKQLPTFRGDSRFGSWLFPLVTRRAIDHLRKRRRWFDRFLSFSRSRDGDGQETTFDPVEPGPGAASLLESKERRAQVEHALAALPPDLRAVLALREIEGLSYAEIAAAIGCPAGTVMSRLHHARRQLTRHLKDLPCA